jgi:hypothetical protein
MEVGNHPSVMANGGATLGVCATPTTGATTYTHDALNMLKTVATGGSATATYTYDGDGLDPIRLLTNASDAAS